MKPIAFPDAFDAIQDAIHDDTLSDGYWDACMMHYAANGATSVEGCVEAGWPKWLVDLNILLFDAKVGVEDEGKARAQFALDLTRLVQVPRDFDRAHDLFVVSTLRRLPALPSVVTVIALYERRLSGGVVTDKEWDAARDAAYTAAYTAASATARDAARTAACTAARDAAYNAARTAACTAARAGLIKAIADA